MKILSEHFIQKDSVITCMVQAYNESLFVCQFFVLKTNVGVRALCLLWISDWSGAGSWMMKAGPPVSGALT